MKMEMKCGVFALCVSAAGVVLAQGQSNARAAYQDQQALREVPRLVQQFDQLLSAQEAISARMAHIESAGKSNDVKAEVAALRAEVADVKRRQSALRDEIVKDLMGRLEPLFAKQDARIAAQDARIAAAEKARPAAPSGGGRRGKAAPAESAAPAVSPTGKVYNHVVEPGQTLSEIARGYGVTVSRVLEFNPGLKPERLKVGQTVVVPEK